MTRIISSTDTCQALKHLMNGKELNNLSKPDHDAIDQLTI